MLIVCGCAEESYLQVSTPYLNFPAEGGSATIYVESNTNWWWNAAWDDLISPSSGYGQGNDEVTIVVSPNPNQTRWESAIIFEYYNNDRNYSTQIFVTVEAGNGGNNNNNNNDNNHENEEPEVSELKAPQNLTAQLYNNSGIKLTWVDANNVEKYKIYRCSPSSQSYTLLKTINYSAGYNSYYDYPTESGTYKYKMCSVGYNGEESDYSNIATINFSIPLTAPTNVKARINGESIYVSWNPVPGAEKYQVYYVRPAPYDIETFENTYATDITFYPKNMTGIWKIWVKAVSASYEISEASAKVSVNYTSSSSGSSGGSSGSTTSKLDTPTNLDYATDIYYVQISFDEVPLAYKYELYRSTSSSYGYKKISASGGSTSGNRYVLTDQSPLSGTSYYKVKAIALSSLGIEDSNYSSYIKVVR